MIALGIMFVVFAEVGGDDSLKIPIFSIGAVFVVTSGFFILLGRKYSADANKGPQG
jgi:uncharacterized membrane protein